MNKKLIIQLTIIVVAFGAAGLILYNGFFNQGSAPTLGTLVVAGGASGPVTPQQILPYGSNAFDFGPLTSRPFIFNQIQYPSINPATDVGIPPSSLIANKLTTPGQ